MSETITSPEINNSQEELKKPNIFKRFYAKYPRLTRIGAATAAAVAVVGTVTAVKSKKESDDSNFAGELNSSEDSNTLDTETVLVTEV